MPSQSAHGRLCTPTPTYTPTHLTSTKTHMYTPAGHVRPAAAAKAAAAAVCCTPPDHRHTPLSPPRQPDRDRLTQRHQHTHSDTRRRAQAPAHRHTDREGDRHSRTSTQTHRHTHSAPLSAQLTACRTAGWSCPRSASRLLPWPSMPSTGCTGHRKTLRPRCTAAASR